MLPVFIETRVFSRQADSLLNQEDREFIVEALLADPVAGDVIPRSGGLRKLRLPGSGRGKRGGLRVIYARRGSDIVYLLIVYAKNEFDDLTSDQYKRLREAIDN